MGTNPLLFDTDEDGLSDGQEISVHGSNPLLKDTDGDGFEDAMEALEGSDPNSALSIPPSSIVVSYSPSLGNVSPIGGWTTGNASTSFLSIGSSLSPPVLNNSDLSLLYGFLFSTHSTSNPRTSDVDADGLPDVWERSYGLDDTLADHDMDLDEDGLTNAGEFAAGD